MSGFSSKTINWITLYFFSLFTFICLFEILSGPLQDWNARRLVTSIGLTFGENVFSKIGEGPTISGRNAPLSALAYVPAALASNPIQAVNIGVFLSLLFAFGGTVVAIVSLKSRANSVLSSSFLFGLFFFFVLASPSLRLSYFIIHADAPAIGFALVFFFYTHRYLNKLKIIDLNLAILFGCASALSKITFHPLLVGLILLVWIVLGPSVALRCFLRCLFIYGILTFFLAAWVGFRNYPELFLHLTFKSPWLVPDSGVAQSQSDRLWALVLGLRDLIRSHLLQVLGMLGLLFLRFRGVTDKRKEIISEFKAPWFIATLLALVMLPGGLMGRAKAGGTENSWSTSIVFLTLGVVCLIKDRLDSGREKETKMAIFLFLSLSLVGLRKVRSLLIFYPSIKNSGTHLSYEFAKNHPGKIYFPEYPLTNLYVDKKVYHSGAALSEFLFVGIPFERSVIDSYLPRNLEWVLVRGSLDGPPAYLSEFSQKEIHPHMPGWEVWKRAG